MALAKFDVLVLGAGVVGVSAALHLQQRGRSVAILERMSAPAGETSFGNTGIIQSEAVFPYMLPRAPLEIARAALNRDPRAQIRYSALPSIAPWLWRYFLASSPHGRLRTAQAMRGLVQICSAEHLAIAAPAGASALLRATGWIKIYRTLRGLDSVLQDMEETKSFDIASVTLSRDGLHALEPFLSDRAQGGVHFTGPLTTPDPAALIERYAALFSERGGRLLRGDARSLRQSGAIWSAQGGEGPIEAIEVVVALGPWSASFAAELGYAFPFGVKRGYHMHYAAQGDAELGRPVLDLESGYVLTPMTRGIRLTTGAEFARLDDAPSNRHLDRLEPLARQMFPLGARLDKAPWMGSRPCLPDMAPVIGPAPRHKGLWFDFGQQHLGLTLGPASGRLLAELMTGEHPFTDPEPFRMERFG